MDLVVHHLNGEILSKEPNDILDSCCFNGEPSPNDQITKMLLLEDLDGEEIW